MIVQVKTGVDHIVRISCKSLPIRDSHLSQTILHSHLKTLKCKSQVNRSHQIVPNTLLTCKGHFFSDNSRSPKEVDQKMHPKLFKGFLEAFEGYAVSILISGNDFQAFGPKILDKVYEKSPTKVQSTFLLCLFGEPLSSEKK